MKTLKLSIALVIGFAGIVSANGIINSVIDHTTPHSFSSVANERVDSIPTEDVPRNHFDTVMNEDGGDDADGSCADPTDDLCAD